MLSKVISRARILLKEAQIELPAEAADDVKRVYSEIYNLNTSLNKEVEATVKESRLEGRSRKDAKRSILEKTGLVRNR